MVDSMCYLCPGTCVTHVPTPNKEPALPMLSTKRPEAVTTLAHGVSHGAPATSNKKGRRPTQLLRRIIPKCNFRRTQLRACPTTIETHPETNSHDDVPFGFQCTKSLIVSSMG